MTLSNIEQACKELDFIYMDNLNSHHFKHKDGTVFAIFSYDWKEVTCMMYHANKNIVDKFMQLYSIINTDPAMLELI